MNCPDGYRTLEINVGNLKCYDKITQGRTRAYNEFNPASTTPGNGMMIIYTKRRERAVNACMTNDRYQPFAKQLHE